MTENIPPEFLTFETIEEPPKEIPLVFTNLRLKPGQKLVLLDRRQFGMDEGAQMDWEDKLRTAFEEAGQLDWDFRWVTLPCGDTVLAVAADEVPGADGLVPAILVAIAEEKWTVADFIASIGDGRFFGPECEIKRITDAQPKDGQALLAYVEEGEVYDPATHQTTHEVVNQGVVDSLTRDYDVRTYQIRLDKPELYARKLATYARRWNKEPSKKAALMEPKRVTIQQQQRSLVSYAFRPAVVDPLLDRFETPGVIFENLKHVPWTPAGNISKKKGVVNPFAGIKYLAEDGLTRANAIVWAKAPSKEEDETSNSETSSEEEKTPVSHNESPTEVPKETPPEQLPQQEAKLSAPLEPVKESLTPDELKNKITDKDIEGV